ncbi:MAG: class I SAM-dependent methyltransferase [Promethearchaeota archaeon]|nr:MAG: class I SAM-dependent methyltransferase [Candidatus Lokiarchaeota archaeon]
MDDHEKKKVLSKFHHIFESEENYYSKKILGPEKALDLEDENFFRQINLKLKKALGNVKGKKVLDVGCGRGRLSFYLAQNGANVVGIDLSKNFIDFCNKKLKKSNLQIDFKVMNAQIPDFEDNMFDIIVGSRIIHHLPDIELFFRECKRLLKKKGFITFIEPLKRNPIVEMNRRHLNPKGRTIHEHPLLISDIMKVKKMFGNIKHSEYYIISPMAMIFKNLFRSPRLFRILYKILQLLEGPLYKIKFLRQYCWQTIFRSTKV